LDTFIHISKVYLLVELGIIFEIDISSNATKFGIGAHEKYSEQYSLSKKTDFFVL
jgi:hypothetical protein